MWTSITFAFTITALGVAIIVLVYFLVRETRETKRVSAELRNWFEHLVANDIKPQPDWPQWAKEIYENYYSRYRTSFDECSYRMQHLVISRYTVLLLQQKFHWLHSEQQNIKGLLREIDKYDAAPAILVQTRERFNTLCEQVDRIPVPVPVSITSRCEFIKIRLQKMQPDKRDEYPDLYRSLKNIEVSMDYIDDDIAQLKAA